MSVVFGCILFALIETLPLLVVELSVSTILVAIFLAVFASLFSLPFAIVGGYTLGWLLHRMQWNKHGNMKAVVSGVMIACITLGVIFVVGGFVQSCVGSHGKCDEDIFAYMKQVVLDELQHSSLTKSGRVFVSRFFVALFIAAAGGGVTGWQLSRLKYRPVKMNQ